MKRLLCLPFHLLSDHKCLSKFKCTVFHCCMAWCQNQRGYHTLRLPLTPCNRQSGHLIVGLSDCLWSVNQTKWSFYFRAANIQILELLFFMLLHFSLIYPGCWFCCPFLCLAQEGNVPFCNHACKASNGFVAFSTRESADGGHNTRPIRINELWVEIQMIKCSNDNK